MKRRFLGEKKQKYALSAEENEGDSTINIPALFQKSANSYSNLNNINPDIAFELNKEFRQMLHLD
jgi:hypothetical protein